MKNSSENAEVQREFKNRDKYRKLILELLNKIGMQDEKVYSLDRALNNADNNTKTLIEDLTELGEKYQTAVYKLKLLEQEDLSNPIDTDLEKLIKSKLDGLSLESKKVINERYEKEQDDFQRERNERRKKIYGEPPELLVKRINKGV